MYYVQSFWWIIYFMKEWKPYFLAIKRQSINKKIEWTSPKWKANDWEEPLDASKREIFEETWISGDLLIYKTKLWTFSIVFEDSGFYKKVTYFLYEYFWEENKIRVANAEWYVGIYNWLPIEQILNLVHYSWLREIYRKWYKYLVDKK